jgi:hypothetical protein
MACVRRSRGRWVVDYRNLSGTRQIKVCETKSKAQDRLLDGGAYAKAEEPGPSWRRTFRKVQMNLQLAGKRLPARGAMLTHAGAECPSLPECDPTRWDRPTAASVGRVHRNWSSRAGRAGRARRSGAPRSSRPA